MKKKTLRMMGLLSLVCIAVCLLIGYKWYNKPHRSAAIETAVSLTAEQFVGEYEKDEAAANKKYLGNAVQVSGTVSEVSLNQQNRQVVLLTGSAMSGVQCTLQDEGVNIKKGDAVIMKGFCSGFLTGVIMDRCIVVR